MTQRQHHNWNGGRDGRRAQAMREAVNAHINARVTEALFAPRKRELKEMLAEAAANTARIQVKEPQP